MTGPNGSVVATWTRAIAVVGIPGAIAIFLVYIGATEIPRLTRQVETIQREAEAMREMTREHAVQNDELLRLMRWICAGVAKDDFDRRQCFEK